MSLFLNQYSKEKFMYSENQINMHLNVLDYGGACRKAVHLIQHWKYLFMILSLWDCNVPMSLFLFIFIFDAFIEFKMVQSSFLSVFLLAPTTYFVFLCVYVCSWNLVPGYDTYQASALPLSLIPMVWPNYVFFALFLVLLYFFVNLFFL